MCSLRFDLVFKHLLTVSACQLLPCSISYRTLTWFSVISVHFIIWFRILVWEKVAHYVATSFASVRGSRRGNWKCSNYKCANLWDIKVCYLLEPQISTTFWILDAVNRLIVDPDGSSKSIQMKMDPILEIQIFQSHTQQIFRECLPLPITCHMSHITCLSICFFYTKWWHN